MRRIRRFLFVVALLPSAALAQDYSAEAKARMGLSFDFDEVQELLDAPWPAMDLPGPAQLSVLPLEPNSDVDTVSVFRDRALVTRVMTAPVEAGGRSLTFEGLPLGLMPHSLNASLRVGDGRIVGVEMASGLGEVVETARIEEVRAEMLEMAAELGEIQDRIESLLAQRAYLRASLVRNADGPAPALGDVRSALEYVGDTERDIAQRLREQEKRAQELDEELSPLLVKLKNPLATGQRVRVDLQADVAGEVTVALNYQVHGAGWVPTYNARLGESDGRVELEYFGVVSQTTGEDWTDAALLLSTARPSSAGALPELTPWFLGRDVYGYTTSVSEGLVYGGGHFEVGRAPGQALEMPDGVLATEMSADVQGSGAAVFAIPGSRTVAGDGSSTRLPIGSQTFAATVELATVPKLVPEVFRRARIRYQGDVPLIPGAVSAYVGSDYVGSQTIEAVVPGEALELSFGTDDRLKVARRLVSREIENVGLTRRSVRYTFDFRIEVSNFTDRAQTVEVVDQLPVSESERVTVKVIEVSEGLANDEDDAPGMLRWRPTVAAGDSRSLMVRFSVTAPAEEVGAYIYELENMY